MDFIGQIADLGIAGATLVATGWATAKWLRRPRFICGIPPSIEERTRENIDPKRLGHHSVATAFQHESHCFAERFRDPHRDQLSEDDARRLREDPERGRTITTDEQGRASVPILIANAGKRVADYSATITFYADRGKVHVTDVVTETVPVSLYVDEPDRVVDPERVHCADERIVAAYNEYLMDDQMRSWGDVVVLSNGHLEASLFELVVVDVQIDKGLSEFFVVFSIDCTDGWIGAQNYIQGCVVSRDRAALEAPPRQEPVQVGAS
jgi:hypothetical protein